MRNLTFIIAAIATTAAITSCSKDKELDDLAKAQQCLDQVDQANPASANDCMQYVEKYDSQHANFLKCGISLTSGGLVENKMVQAANQLKDTSAVTNKEAVYMAILSLDPVVCGSLNNAYTKAQTADTFCQASGVSGLKYLSGVILVGTYMNKLAGGIDITNPAAAETAINNMLATCNADTTDSNPDCAANLATIGTAVVQLSESYCAGASADKDVCEDIDEAVAQAGGIPANVGEALFCYLAKKTYNSSTGECNP